MSKKINLLSAREAIEKAQMVRENIPAYKAAISKSFTLTQEQHGFSGVEMATLFGMTPTACSKMKSRESMTLDTFLTYCMVFNMDFKSSMINSQKSSDTISAETSTLLGALPLSTLIEILNVVDTLEKNSASPVFSTFLASLIKSKDNRSLKK